MKPSELKQAREKAGITQEQMALKLGVGTSTLRRWERSEIFTAREQSSVDARYNNAKAEIESHWESQNKGEG